MIARASQLFLPTLRDPPADAEAVSTQPAVVSYRTTVTVSYTLKGP